MARFQDQILDEHLHPVPGAQILVFHADEPLNDQQADLTDDADLPLAQPLASDTDGIFYYNAANGLYENRVYYGGRLRYVQQAQLGPGGEPGPPGPPGDIGKLLTRADIAAIGGMVAGQTVYLAEAGREGMFTYRAGDYTARVAADTEQGLFVAPDSGPTGAAGAWVREPSDGVSAKWFGAKGDGVTNDGTAMLAALAALKATAVNDDVFYKGSQRLFIPAGHYYLGLNTLEISHGLIVEGESAPMNWGISTKLRWDDGCSGFRIIGHNNHGAGAVDGSPFHYSGSRANIRRLAIVGPFGGSGDFTGHAENEYHAIHCRAQFGLEDLFIDGWAGDGIYANCSSGAGDASEGNCNCSFARNINISQCRNGVFMDGADSNACVFASIITVYCRQHAVWDSSFLGNTHIGHHSANAGLVPGVPPSVVTHAGNRYFVKMGQAAGCSANAPSGTTASNAYWLFLSAGGAASYLNIAAWANGTVYRDGGGYRNDNLNSFSVYIGCYQEGGEATTQIKSPATAMGGLGDYISDGNQYHGQMLQAPNGVKLGKSLIADLSGSADINAAVPILRVHNTLVLSTGVAVRSDLCQGFEADGVTPLPVAATFALPNSAVPANVEGTWGVATRQYLTGAMTARFIFDTANSALRPYDTGVYSLGLAGIYWKDLFVGAGGVKVAGNQVIGARQAAIANHPTDATVNSILAAMRTHGLIAP